MYLPVIEPIDRVCREAIELGVAGDIAGARVLIDRVRTMRKWLSRSVASNRAESIEVWIENSGIDESEMHQYRSQIAQLSAHLEIIRTWISSSASAFSDEELLSSQEGLSLYLDRLLPEVWDFSQDVVVLHGEHWRLIFEDLKLRGQRNFVIIEGNGESDPDQIMVGSGEDSSDEQVEPINLVIFPTGATPQTDIFSDFDVQEVPLVVLVGTESDPEAENDFRHIFELLSVALLAKVSTQQWPELFTRQLLSRLPALAECQSAGTLRSIFQGRDVLIASPGPSLVDSLCDLKANRDRFLLIAPIRSLLTLLNSGIVPDFVFHVDGTDFSKIIPRHPLLHQLPLICTDYAHHSVFEGGFGSLYTAPEPSIASNAISEALHGCDVPMLQGGGVATCAVAFSAQMGASSITLVGQDLSMSRGTYVAQTANANTVATGYTEFKTYSLTCEGINGERLPTKEDYAWFIGELENLARVFSKTVSFFNSTSHGAFLKGWDHKTLDLHPLVTDASDNDGPSPDKTESMSSTDREIRRTKLIQAVQSEQADVAAEVDLCGKLVMELRSLVASKSNDVTEVEMLEARLKLLLSKPGSLLYFYTTRFSMALAAALKSVKSLEENLTISADYYHHLGLRAKKLAAMLEDAAKGLQLESDSAAFENGH
jgi:hypothetical protein